MSWRDLPPFPDDWSEPERPDITTSPREGYAGTVEATFADEVSRQWFAEWLKSKRGWMAFMAWVDEKR